MEESSNPARTAKQKISFRSPRRAKVRASLKQSLESTDGSDEDADWGMQVLEDAAADMNTIGDYLLGQILGKGSQGIVYKALHIKTGKFVAVKQIFFNESEQDKSIQATKDEIKMLSTLSHANIIKYNEILRKQDSLYIVLEYIESGSLKDIIHRFGTFPEPLAAVYVKQILHGLVYLHSKNIIHRDIKGGNILITKDGVCKLADFGLAKMDVNRLSSIGPAGTTYWMAPELFDSDMGKIGTPSDIWSLGATIVEIITGKPPFQSLGPLAAIYQIAEGDSSPIPIGISEMLASFLDGCFTRNPNHRMSALELLNHQWITGKTINQNSIKQSGNFGTLVKALKDYRASGEDKNISVSSGSFGLIRRSSFRSKTKLRRKDVTTLFTEIKPIDTGNCMSSMDENTSADFFTSADTTGMRNLLAQISSNPPNLMALCSQMSRKMEEILESNAQMEHELTLANTETEQLAGDRIKANEEIDRLMRGNHYLREKIQFLEGNINMSDYDMAQILYGDDLNWNGFPESTKRGVLKIMMKGKWKKRLVALRDNFIFLFRPETEDDPIDVVKLVDVVISTDHRKLHPNSFCVNTSGRQSSILFLAANFEIMTQWMQALTFTKPWYEEVPDDAYINPNKPSTRRINPKVERARSNTSHVIQLARNTLRKYSNSNGQ